MKETGWRANQLRIDNTSFLGHTFRTYPGSIALYALRRKKTRQKSDNLTKTRREKLCIWSAVSGPQTKNKPLPAGSGLPLEIQAVPAAKL